MAAETKIERQNERDPLTETELDGVVGGMQLLSNLLRMMADTQKAVISNFR